MNAPLPLQLSGSLWWQQAPLAVRLIQLLHPRRVGLLGCSDPAPAAYLRDVLGALSPDHTLIDLPHPQQPPTGALDLLLVSADQAGDQVVAWLDALPKPAVALLPPDGLPAEQPPGWCSSSVIPGLLWQGSQPPSWLVDLETEGRALHEEGTRLHALAQWATGLQRPVLATQQEALQQQLDDTVLKLEAIEQSRIWRLSAPVRRWPRLRQRLLGGLRAQPARGPRLTWQSGRQPLLPKRPTLLVLSHESSATGAPILVWNLCRCLNARHNVVVLSLRSGLLDEALRDVSCVLATKPLAEPPGPHLLQELIDRLPPACRPSSCLVNTIQGWAWLEWLRRLQIASLLLVHEFAAYTRPRHAFQAALLWAGEVVFSSEATLKDARSHFPDLQNRPVRVLPQGQCDLPGALQPSEATAAWLDIPALRQHHSERWLQQAVVVMGAGAVQPRKGVDLFVAAAQRLRRALPEAPLLFLWVGDGYDPELDYAASIWIADQIQRSGLSDCLHIVEASAAYRSCLRRADLFWLTSRLDPMPNVAIDALLCGTPVLCFAEASGTATWLQSDPEIGTSCVANYLDTEHLAALSAALIEQPQQRAALSQHLQERADQTFRMERYAQQLAGWLQEAEHKLEQQQHECALLRAGDHLNTSFFLSPAIDPGDEPLVPYLMAWANQMHQRKPKPGLHPGVYQTHHPELRGDPFAACVQQGQPPGPWLTPVIEPGAIKRPAQLSVGLHLHVHYPELLDGLLQQLRFNQIRPALWISLSDASARSRVEHCLQRADLECEALLVCPNRGRDLGPLLVEFGQELDRRYAIHGHLHTKKSVLVDQAFAGRWRTFLQGNLLGQPGVAMLDLIAAAMETNPQLGLVYPDDPNIVGWGNNRPIAQQLLSQLGLSTTLPDQLNFPVGSMFWARRGALSRLYQAGWSYEDFPEEPIGYDGTLLHAIERLLPVINASAGYSEALTHVPGLSR